MKYEIVNVKEKIVVGIGATTSNSSPDMGEVITGLWEKLYYGGINSSIKNKVNEFAIGLYCEYLDDQYTVLTGNEVSMADNDEFTVRIIPAGKYAKFSVHGNMETAVAEAWGEIWKMNLDRSFTGDFEEYLNSDWENADIDIYIALK